MALSRSQSLASDFSPEEVEPSWVSGGRFRYPVVSELDPWEACLKSVQRHDKEMCDSWRDEVDKLLIFAGLFSAAVTAFVVESYKMLQPDPTDLLAAKIANISNNQASSVIAVFEPQPFAVRVNIFWFLSLVLSLSAVFIGVLSMQWLREYNRGESNTAAQDALGLRQMRHQGLLAWRVPEIISTLPLLLQTALFLFFCGILDLLWSIHQVVAIVITIPVALLAAFFAITTFLPALQYAFARQLDLNVPQCPYKSPQSWNFHRTFSALCVLVFQIYEYLNFKSMFHFQTRERRSLLRGLFAAPDWRAFDRRWRQQRDLQLRKPQPGGLVGQFIVRKDIARGLAWLINSFSRDMRVITALYKCIQALSDDEKEVVFLACSRTTPLSIDFRNKLGGGGAPAISDYLCLRILDHLLFTTSYGSDAARSLLQHRVELYIRVVRASIHISRRPMLYCPFKYFSLFSEEVQTQLLGIATLFLSRSDRESDAATAVMIICQISKHPAMRSPLFAHGATLEVDHILGGHKESAMEASAGLRQAFSTALTEVTKCFQARPEISKQQSVRVRVYQWFLDVINQPSSSFNPVLNSTLQVFKVIGPIIQSATLPTSLDSEYPTNPIFKKAWKLLLDGKYSELPHVTAQLGPVDTVPL